MSSIDRTAQTLREWLESGIWPQGSRIPTLAELAKKCGVSRTTAWLAIGNLKKSSLVYTKRNGMIFAGSPTTGRPDSPQPLFVWEQIKNRIGEEILSGSFQDSPLPPTNKLALSYGTALGTMKRALECLTKDGLLERAGRGYRPFSRSERRHSGTILLIGEGRTGEGLNLDVQRILQINELLDRACQRLGYLVRSVGFDSLELLSARL